MSPCIFCKIVAKEVPAKIAYEDESCLAFHDINPQAPLHLLVIPRKHFASAAEAGEADEALLGHLYRVAAKLAEEHQAADGYRIVVNTGLGAGQSVFHFHLHVLGGRSFRWPPG
ncbi:MAG: histidine triad nucleotide-binding protein [Acidobacteria bacterium]|nr:histidine triad nucleotide-binding protein [Acidobacteriota bacterium]